MKSKIALASMLALIAVSAHARAIPLIACKSAHLAIRINKASCHIVGTAKDPICQAFVAVGTATEQVELSLIMGPFPQTNIQSLMFQSTDKPSTVAFLGNSRGIPNTYQGQGRVKLGDVDTTEDMICIDVQPQPGHL